MKKLILSICMLVATIASLTTSTFAFIVISNEVGIKEYEFNVTSQVGLQLSLDGKLYSNDISSENITKKISENYEALVFTGVTPKQELVEDSKQIVFDNKRMQFVKDSINSVNTHEFIGADANKDYIVFDLWLKLLNSDLEDKTEYILKMTGNTDITSNKETVKLDNNLVTMDGTVYGPLEENKEIDVNMQDAMRMAVDINDSNSLTIYEMHDSLGSHAVEGSEDPKHDKNKNAMYTYYNNVMWKYPLDVAGDDYNTESDVTSQVLATFSNKSTTVVKLTYYIWLEGWDADFLIGMSTSARTARINMEFGITKA